MNLARATKPALIDELQRTAAELAEAHELLQAIAEMTRAGDVDVEWAGAWAAQRLGRIQHAAETATANHDYGQPARTLRALLADDRAAK